MTNVICVRAPAPDHPSYIAAKAMLHSAPMRPEQIFELADFGPVKNRLARLNPTIDSGWFHYVPGGRLIVSQFAVDHFRVKVATSAHEGQLATPRVNVNAGLPLSARHRINSKGTRTDAMDARSFPSHYAKVTP